MKCPKCGGLVVEDVESNYRYCVLCGCVVYKERK